MYTVMHNMSHNQRWLYECECELEETAFRIEETEEDIYLSFGTPDPALVQRLNYLQAYQRRLQAELVTIPKL